MASDRQPPRAATPAAPQLRRRFPRVEFDSLELTQLSLDKVCGHVDKVESPKFDGILAGYEVMPPDMVKQCINAIRLWQEPKEKLYFQKSVKSDNLDGDE